MGAASFLVEAGIAPDAKILESVFARRFYASDNTRLVGGFDEPLYQPASAPGQQHSLYYREDFFASALHEVAHWCIAGYDRRQLTDFGYWYEPDGRDTPQQEAFLSVEFKPQALQWFFSKACRYPFRLSGDNLAGAGDAIQLDKSFEQRVIAQARAWCGTDLPTLACLFFSTLCEEFGTVDDLTRLEFLPSELE